MDVVPLTPVVVDCVTFDRAPLGRRGYNEDQVDDFLDRVQATLEGKDSLTAQSVRDAIFDPAPFIRRGYHEEQVDAFLDLVVEELTRREGPPLTQARQAPPPTEAEQTAPMLFTQPPSMPAPSTQPLKRDERTASGPPKSSVPTHPDNPAPQGNHPGVAEKVQPATAKATPTPAAPAHAPAPASQPSVATPTGTTTAGAATSPADARTSPTPAKVTAPSAAAPEAANTSVVGEHDEAWREADRLVLPLPPALPGERGYRPEDVERLMGFLADALDGDRSPSPGELGEFTLSRTVSVGRGYHVGVVDAVRRAWVDEFRRRAL